MLAEDSFFQGALLINFLLILGSNVIKMAGSVGSFFRLVAFSLGFQLFRWAFSMLLVCFLMQCASICCICTTFYIISGQHASYVLGCTSNFIIVIFCSSLQQFTLHRICTYVCVHVCVHRAYVSAYMCVVVCVCEFLCVRVCVRIRTGCACSSDSLYKSLHSTVPEEEYINH